MSDLPTVKDIRRLLFSIRRKWYHIGIELDVDIEVLDTIRDTYSDLNDCLTEMIKKLKKSNKLNLTWKALAEALRAEPVDELEIAQKADEKHNQCSTPQMCLVTRTHKESRLRDIFDDIDENFQYPLLKVQNLTDKEVKQLKIRLNSDTTTICCSFASLAGGVAMCLKDSKVTAEDLKTFFIHGEFNSLAGFIDVSDNINDVMTKVKQEGYWSFFNYEILETVIRRYCVQLISELEDYKSNFEIYCRRRVSEVPIAILKRGESTTSSPQSATEFCVKLDDTFSISTSSMISIKDVVAYKIQKILNIKMPLQLVDVQSGCILLTLRYFGKSSTLFPLDEEQKSSLAEVGVCRIYCDEYEVKLKNGPYLEAVPSMSAHTHDHTPPQQSSGPVTTVSAPTHDHAPPQQPPSTAPATTVSAPKHDHTPPQQSSSSVPGTTTSRTHDHALPQQPSSAPVTTASPTHDHTPPQQPSTAPATTVSAPTHDHTPPQQPPSSSSATTVFSVLNHTPSCQGLWSFLIQVAILVFIILVITLCLLIVSNELKPVRENFSVKILEIDLIMENITVDRTENITFDLSMVNITRMENNTVHCLLLRAYSFAGSITIIGNAGTGKSSLAIAGIVPRTSEFCVDVIVRIFDNDTFIAKKDAFYFNVLTDSQCSITTGNGNSNVANITTQFVLFYAAFLYLLIVLLVGIVVLLLFKHRLKSKWRPNTTVRTINVRDDCHCEPSVFCHNLNRKCYVPLPTDSSQRRIPWNISS